MSMTLLVIVGLSCGLTTAEINIEAKRLGLPIVLSPEEDLRTHSGFLPVKLTQVDSGVETYYIDDQQALASLPPNASVLQGKSAILQFRWGSDFQEGAIALYIGYLLSKTCNAVLVDTESGNYMPADAALQGAEAMVSMGKSR